MTNLHIKGRNKDCSFWTITITFYVEHPEVFYSVFISLELSLTLNANIFTYVIAALIYLTNLSLKVNTIKTSLSYCVTRNFCWNFLPLIVTKHGH